ncbi:MAG: ribosome silencing factor [Actinobacteria bacterium]|nr:ribosome silencing factor [Actinomycetota bacterium]NDH13272.1 ribosome silencing factor [Actinomycetota bacterium]
MPARESTIALTQRAAQAVIEKLGTNLVAVDLSEQLVLSEVFLIVTGQNERQVDAIADEVERKLAEIGEKPARRESTGHWVLLDYSDLVVHIQSEEIRQYYMLDRLWSDCPIIKLDAVTELEKLKRG